MFQVERAFGFTEYFIRSKQMSRWTIVVMLVMLTVLNGCCSLFREGSQVVRVNSVPEGATVKLGDAEGKTPYTLTVPKGKEYVINAKLGGETKSMSLNRKVDGLYWVNILVWPGLIVDAITGKMFVYDPTEYNFDFTK